MASFQPLTSTTPAPTTGTAGFLATNWLAPTTGTTQVGPPKPTIIATAKPATTQLNNITTQAKNIDSSMAAQSQRIAQDKAASDAAAAQAKAVTDAAAAKKTTEDANAKAIADATAALEKYNLPTGAKLGDNGTVLDANGNSIGDASKYLKPTDGSIAGDAAKLAADRDLAFEQMKKDTEAYRNGSIPLTPDQQAQVDNLQRQFDEAKKQQQLYNQNYEGGTNIASIVSGRARYAPEIAMGQLKAAQNEGVAKITELDQKAASAIATMKQAFKDSNYKGIQAAYDLYNDYQKQKSAELQKQVENVAAAKKEMREEKQQEFENTLNSDKFTWQQKQDLVDNEIKKGTLNLAQQKFAQDKMESLRTYNLALAKFNAEQGGAGGNEALMAAAREYAGSGKMPTWVTKEDAAKIAILSKQIPQPEGRLVDSITGMPRMGLSPTREAGIIALKDSLRTLDIMQKSFGGFHQGLLGPLGSILPSDARVMYDTMKAEFMSKLLVARSGLAVSDKEYDRLSKLVPEDFNQTLWLGASGEEKLANLKTSIQNNLDLALSTDGLTIVKGADSDADAVSKIQQFRGQSSENDALAQKLINENPELTAQDILQILAP